MIQLIVSSTSEKQILEIAELLIKERYVIDLNILPNHKRLSLENEKIISSDLFLLTGKTKGLLFTTIDELLNEKYPTDLPEIYSLPIVHMDWEQLKQLTEDIKVV
ncbi:MAG: divalent cation tolerance protein CutA [Salibacteraceae bacterium]|nr:divalent cation tolerance protein CutA [Salibacteraceae bacterium]